MQNLLAFLQCHTWLGILPSQTLSVSQCWSLSVPVLWNAKGLACKTSGLGTHLSICKDSLKMNFDQCHPCAWPYPSSSPQLHCEELHAVSDYKSNGVIVCRQWERNMENHAWWWNAEKKASAIRHTWAEIKAVSIVVLWLFYYSHGRKSGSFGTFCRLHG